MGGHIPRDVSPALLTLVEGIGIKVNDIISSVVDLAQLNPLAAVSAAIILAFLLFWRPKIFFILLAVAIAAAGVMELFARLSETGL